MELSSLVVWILSPLLALTLLRYWSTKNALPLPPGPRPLPLLGNLFDIPTVREELTYTKWGKEYGDIVHVSALNKNIIILNSVSAAYELLDQRAGIYSDRPYLAMMHDPKLMNCSDFLFPMSRYGESWKRQRKLFMHYINPGAVTQVFSLEQIASVHILLRQILLDPTSIREHLLHASASVILGTSYGYNVQLKNDPFVKLAVEVVTHLTEAFTPKYLVNIFPILRNIPSWIPGAGFKTFAIRTKRTIEELIEQPYNWLREQTAIGESRPSFTQNALNEMIETGDFTQLEDIKKVAAAMFSAGVDATVVVIYSFILQMVLNPVIQRRAQAELDTVIGPPNSSVFRLPTFKDRPNLPYIDALAKECIRWHPSAPSGVPHASMEEDEYRGWRIPKGSIIFPNAWGMLRDENIYPDPYTFNPERFVATKEKLAEPDPSVCGAFGFGRRVCPGRLLAETSIWLQVASLLAAFDFAPAKDSNGNDIDVTYALEPMPGFVLDIPNFPCLLTPRSKHVEEVIWET